MFKSTFNPFLILIYIAVPVGGGWLLYSYREDLIALPWAPEWMLALLCVGILGIFAKAHLQRLMLLPFDIDLKLREGSGLSILSTIAENLLPIGMGSLIKPAYLWRVHKLEPTRSGLMVGVSTILYTIVSIALALIASLLLPSEVFIAEAILVLALISFVCLLILPLQIGRFVPISIFQKIHDAWKILIRNRALFVKIVAWQTILVVLDIIRLWIGFQIIGQSVGALFTTVVSGVAMLSSWALITPGAIGWVEGSVGYISSVYGVGLLEGATAAFISRIALLSACLVLYAWACPRILKEAIVPTKSA